MFLDHDPANLALWMVAATVALAGVVRGFSGFGTAMIIMPVVSALYSPAIALAFLILVDGSVALVMAVQMRHRMVLRDVIPLAVSSTIALPFGLTVLLWADPNILRWVISGIILVVVVVMAVGWRYRGTPSLKATVSVGAAAGTLAGATGLGGPPIILFWLSGQQDSATIRANIIGYFGLTTISSFLVLYWNGLFTLEVLSLALLMIPIFIVTVWGGTRLFPYASQNFFRSFALVLVAMVAISSVILGGS